MEATIGHLSAGMFVHFLRPIRTKFPANFLLGEIFHIFNGIGLGVLLTYLLKGTSKKSYLLKGLTIGGLAWQVLYGVGINLGPLRSKPNLRKTHYSALFLCLLYGVVTSQAIVTLAHSSVFDEKTKQESLDLTVKS